jgi:hypothetical protein
VKCYEVDVKVPKGSEEILVAVVCCLHIGARAYQEEKALQWRRWIMAGKNRLAFGLGDDTENAIPGDEKHNSMMWEQVMSPDEQYQRACEYWLPVAQARRLVLTHDSNHWWRSEAKTGMSRARDMNAFLQGVNEPGRPSPNPQPRPDALPRWARWQALTRLNVGRLSYTIHSWHGVGNGTTPEAALRKCRSMAVQHPDADVFLMGHAHNKICWSDNRTKFTSNGQEAQLKERHFGVTGGFLGWHDTYAERTGLPPNRIGAIVLRLGVKRWDIKLST